MVAGNYCMRGRRNDITLSFNAACQVFHPVTFVPQEAKIHSSEPASRCVPKARIGATEVSFLGHSVPGSGRSPDRDKISASSEVPMTKDVGQVLSILGGLSYYRDFLPNLAECLQPLTDLLKNGIAFNFTHHRD